VAVLGEADFARQGVGETDFLHYVGDFDCGFFS
jgi:hypothetical protein